MHFTPLPYLDPGSGSILIQIAIAALLGLGVAIRASWGSIKKYFGVKLKSDDEDDTELIADTGKVGIEPKPDQDKTLSSTDIHKDISPNNISRGRTMEKTSPIKVFISYASEDQPFVKTLYFELKKILWIDPWLDVEKLLPGQDWKFEIDKAQKAADATLVCISKTSIKKIGVVQEEIRKAEELQRLRPPGYIYIIPVLLEDCDVPMGLKKYHWADFSKLSGFENIVKSLEILKETK